jgi:hypothetical protein
MSDKITVVTPIADGSYIEQGPGGTSYVGPAAVDLFRVRMIKMGLEAEMRGMRLTNKAPRCFKIIEVEYGIKAKRSAEGKRAAYEAFCALHNLPVR